MSTATVKCYIEEYRNQVGDVCARLREIGTDRHVRLAITHPEQGHHFFAFLNKAGALFKEYGRSDPIVVSGILIASTPQSVDIGYDAQTRYFIS